MHYQHGIIGGGCAGLQMLNALLQNPATQNDSIVIFEPDVEKYIREILVLLLCL